MSKINDIFEINQFYNKSKTINDFSKLNESNLNRMQY